MAHRALTIAILAACCASAFAALANIKAEDLEGLKSECVVSGSNLLTLCAEEMNAAQEHYGVEIGTPEFLALNLTKDRTDEILKIIKKPSNDCCRGTCDFNNEFCGCEKQMEGIISSLAGTFSFFRAVSEAVAKECEIPVFYEENCPKKWQKKWKKFKGGDCSKFE